LEPFKVGLTRNFLRADGTFGFGDIGLSALDRGPGIEWSVLQEQTPVLRPDQVAGYDALLVLGGRVTAETLDGVDRLALIARFGVGYDSVDIDACNRHGILVTITPNGIRRSMASSALTLILASAHRLLIKDHLTRAGRWHDRLDFMGVGLAGKTLGSIGLGNIGCELFRLAAPHDMRQIAYDPYAPPERAAAVAVTLVDLPTLLRESDFVSINCALTDETRNLIDRERLALMKPTAFLVNTARGPIVDQPALTEALLAKQIAGAALDVFEREPIDADDPLLALDNIIVTPHAVGWTDEMARLTGADACAAILDVAAGRIPAHVVNREAVDSPLVRERLARHATRAGAWEV
jgi:D-3-phosphoglycerate dehydrogenase